MSILFILITVFWFLFGFNRTSLAQTYDLVNFMKSDYDYNGFTETNSYLGMIGHRYDKVSRKWKYTVPFTSCPGSLGGDCENLDWHFFYQFRQKPGENILYLSKVPWLGKNVEVFWFNKDWVYVFGEPYLDLRFCPGEAWSCFHSFYHDDLNNTNVEFPYRGYVWSKRFITSGERMELPLMWSNYYTNMANYTCYDIENECLYQWPASYFKATYISNWQFPSKTCPECYNLPNNLDVVIIESGIESPRYFKEKYYYAKLGGNTFGMVRFEKWEDKRSLCGSDSCCSGTCEGVYALAEYNNFSLLTKYNEDSGKYFRPNFYNDPKLETRTTNGAFYRGSFRLPGEGFASNGNSYSKGTLMNLTEILTDSDYLISSTGADGRECPDGYSYLGSFVGEHNDHRKVQSQGWTNFCGTNKDVLLAETCPANYYSRGRFLYEGDLTSAYDYMRRAIGGKTINFCVHYNQFHYPKIGLPQDSCLDCYKVGDADCNGSVNIADLIVWYTAYRQGFQEKADFNCDEKVNIGDLVVWYANYRK